MHVCVHVEYDLGVCVCVCVHVEYDLGVCVCVYMWSMIWVHVHVCVRVEYDLGACARGGHANKRRT